MNDDGIALVRLTEVVPIEAVHALLNDTRSHRRLFHRDGCREG